MSPTKLIPDRSRSSRARLFASARKRGKSLGGSKIDRRCSSHGIPWRGEKTLLEPTVNVLIGATYLSELRARFDSWDLALTAYNQGPTKARRLAKSGRTPSSRYAARVLRRFEAWRRGEDG